MLAAVPGARHTDMASDCSSVGEICGSFIHDTLSQVFALGLAISPAAIGRRNGRFECQVAALTILKCVKTVSSCRAYPYSYAVPPFAPIQHPPYRLSGSLTPGRARRLQEVAVELGDPLGRVSIQRRIDRERDHMILPKAGIELMKIR
jgi:hypothetical protein